MERAEEFIARWRGVLEAGALVHFSYGARGGQSGNHCQIADEFVADQGMRPIGFNWELLDVSASEGERRSGMGELVNALTHSLANPSQLWLPSEEARECARGFLGLFDPSSVTLVSNRYDGLWNPVAGGAVEWGFFGFDNDKAVLLLLVSGS